MNLKPFNRRLIVERIVNKANDVSLPVSINDKVVILSHMIEKIEINGETLLAVAENNVIGKII
jgi:co-chaperonin GroES (HSP10)